MIYGDISEKPHVHAVMREKFGEEYVIKELGCYDCKIKKIPMHRNTTRSCCEVHEVELMEKYGFEYDKTNCNNCEDAEYIRFADFEIGEGRAFIERKSASDFLSSRRDRLYHQLDKMDKFVSGRNSVWGGSIPKRDGRGEGCLGVITQKEVHDCPAGAILYSMIVLENKNTCLPSVESFY